MNLTNWVPFFPDEVEFNKSYLIDKSLDMKISLNEVSKNILTLVDGKNTCGDIFEQLKTNYTVDEKTLFRDINELLLSMNSKGLLNLRYSHVSNIIGKIVSVMYLYHPKYHYRVDIDVDKFHQIFHLVLKSVMKQLAIFLILNIIIYSVFLFLDLFILDQSFLVFHKIFGGYLIAFAALVLSFVLHECLHVYTQKKLGNSLAANSCFILVHVFKIVCIRKVIHSKYEFLIPFLGPFVPSLIGSIIILFINTVKVAPSYKPFILVFAVIFCIHIIYLIPFWGDGKNTMLKLAKRMMR